MSETPEQRLANLGISLPQPPAPVASYVPFVRTGNQLWVSGQLPTRNGELPRKGLVGRDITLEHAIEEARFCALNAIAQIKAAVGELDRVRQIVKLNVFVASSEGFHGQPAVANGASDLLVEVFGEIGKHARAAVGVAELPNGTPVEVDLVAEVSD